MTLTALSSCAYRRPVTKTRAPSVAKRLATAKPIPLVPPVTNAVFPVNRAKVVAPLSLWALK
jgi:hypothetical protein